jgi:ABC-type dipeptide/oligopeptide/nickel transport system permease component
VTGLAYLGRRAAGLVAVVGASSWLLGALLSFAPGSAVAEQGLHPWLLGFWAGVATGDLGASYRGIPVLELVIRGAATTLPLVATALLLSLLFAAAVAALGDRRGTGPLRTALHGLSLTPVFLLGYVALVGFGVPPDGPVRWWAAAAILAIGDGTWTEALLGLDAERRRLADTDFVHSMRLRGLALLPRLAPHLALPIAQLLAGRLAYLLSGVLVLEMVLGIQGLGLMGYRAAVKGDFTLLVAIAVGLTGLVASVQWGVEALSVAVDPRVRKDRRRWARGAS